jgi:hypothetical protein
MLQEKINSKKSFFGVWTSSEKWGSRNCRIKERTMRVQSWLLNSLTFSSVFCEICDSLVFILLLWQIVYDPRQDKKAKRHLLSIQICWWKWEFAIQISHEWMVRQRLFLPIWEVKRTDYIISVSHQRVSPSFCSTKNLQFFQKIGKKNNVC